MEENKLAVGDAQNIISIQLNANFFFERALRSLDRYHYDKALKYFQRAVDFEPDNPINYCNMAGILSEIGKYGESNHILRKVLEEIDPTMTECHFFMANNFANMEFFEEAERELIRYLQEDEEGQYLEEAEEMIEFLHEELERPTPVTKVKARAGVYEHIHARELLESGQFVQAIELLENITEEHPDFLAAHNNLALAYYYVGLRDEAKQAIAEVLAKEEANLHALCNLAIFYHYEKNQLELQPLVNILVKLDPFYDEHVFKLATTMGILKEHEAAYRHFTRIIKKGESRKDPCLSHFAAIAACNIGEYETAERLWQRTIQLDTSSPIPHFFLEMLEQLKSAPVRHSFSYNYYDTVDEQLEAWEQYEQDKETGLKSQILRAYFIWALKKGNRAEKLKALQTLEPYSDKLVLQQLKQFLLHPQEDDYLKRIAIFMLRSIEAEGPFQVVLSGGSVKLEACQVMTVMPDWDMGWEHIVQLAIRKMTSNYDIVEQHDMITLWVNFLTKAHPHIPKLSNVAAWAAALEYLTAKMHNKEISYHEVSLRYETSISTISSRVKQLDEVCGIKEKMKTISASWFTSKQHEGRR